MSIWDKLSTSDQNAIAKEAMIGSKQNNENINRVREQLSQNPNLVMKFAKDAGVEMPDAELQSEEDNIDSQSVDANIDAALRQSGDAEITGDLPRTENADMETRIRALESQLGSKTDYRMKNDLNGPDTTSLEEKVKHRMSYDQEGIRRGPTTDAARRGSLR